MPSACCACTSSASTVCVRSMVITGRPNASATSLASSASCGLLCAGMITVITPSGHAICATRATTAESTPPLSPSTMPRAPASWTRSRNHSAIEDARERMG